MNESNYTEELQQIVPAFGYELIREVLLNDILGPEAPAILYWAGKRLARKYPMETMDDLVHFFQQAGWGSLNIKKESNHEMELELSGGLIEKRCMENNQCHFQLEAGFIAEQIELQRKVICETYEHPRKKKGIITFTVKWDKKDFISST